VNFLRRLALQEKKLDDSPRLDVVEIARVTDMLPKLVSFLVGLRTYQHPVKMLQFSHTVLYICWGKNIEHFLKEPQLTAVTGKQCV